MTVLCSLRASQTEAQQREWAAYQQVKQAVEMAEEANLEKTRVCQNDLNMSFTALHDHKYLWSTV